MQESSDWVAGDRKTARWVWFGRIDHIGAVAGLAFAFGVVVGGIVEGPVTRWQEEIWHGDPPFDFTNLVFIGPFILVALACALYCWLRLRNRPADLLAIETSALGVQPVAKPDDEDSDGDPVEYDIKWLTFTPDVNRTFTVPVRFAGTLRTGVVTVRAGSVRLDEVLDREPRQLVNGRWLDTGLDYDDDVLTVGMAG